SENRAADLRLPSQRHEPPGERTLEPASPGQVGRTLSGMSPLIKEALLICLLTQGEAHADLGAARGLTAIGATRVRSVSEIDLGPKRNWLSCVRCVPEKTAR